MYFYNYRFRLPDDIQFSDPEQTSMRIDQMLNASRNLGLVRIAIDLTSPNKSISLLCKSQNAHAIESAVTQILLTQEITLCSDMEEEALWFEEEGAHNGQVFQAESIHTGGIKKKRKKIPHRFSHAPYAHSHSHSTSHEHSHEHSHGHSHEHSHEHSHGHSHEHSHGHSHGHENHWVKAALGLIWGVALLVLAIGSFNIPLLAYYAITGLTTLMTLYLGYTVYQSAWYALLEKKWDTTTLYTISTLTIVAVSIASLFIPGLPMMFEAAPLVLGFWHLGEGIEHTLIDKITRKLDVRDCVDPLVLLKGKPDIEISVKHLIPNDIILVKKGRVIPVDGVLTTEALLYTTRIDGSPELKRFKAGDEVKAGMRLADHIPSLEMRVTKTYQNSYLSLLAENIDKANEEKAPVEIFADKVLKYFIPGLLGIALLSGIIIGSVFNPALAIQCVVSVLVSACPCALSLITPLAVKIGMQKASENGIIFRNGKALQAAANIDTVVFDLNGTLTQGNVTVEALTIDDKKFLSRVALLEGQADHPLAKIIKSYIEDQGIIADEQSEITSVDQRHHSGIKGVIKGETFMIGNKDMLAANGVMQINAPYNNPENGSIYIVREKNVIGQISLIDPLREDAIATVNELKRLGKTVHICTGADRETAEKYAKLLGISKKNIFANTVGVVTRTGEISKESYIEQLKHDGYKVAMVGDAANDLTAIRHSNLGIAVQSKIGDDITQQYAGIVVQQGRLFSIATAFDIAAKTTKNIAQNFCVSLTYNSTITLVAAGLFVALGFALNPALGVALMVLESAIVLLNLYRFKEQEIVTSTSNSNSAGVDEVSEDTTFDLLNVLGYRPQPKSNLDSAGAEPFTMGYQKNPLFTPRSKEKNYSFSVNDVTSCDATCQIF
ncbi:heavy metal translocating P-type ATPase [Legionella bozemanae]|uniref:heavy metal translocating P-type ATPase n=1 Tax=Legionella bozemanae TaxID=447 RepID=UPI00399CDD3A